MSTPNIRDTRPGQANQEVVNGQFLSNGYNRSEFEGSRRWSDAVGIPALERGNEETD